MINRSRCTGCGECADTCPEGALSLNGTPAVDRGRCSGCGSCARICPSGCLRLAGREYTTDEALDEVIRDLDYFNDSRGGATFSGGEPMMHPDFLEALCTLLGERGVDRLLETCGHFSRGPMKKLLPLIDSVYFDIKLIDPEKHRRHTGAGNGIILDNFAWLSEHDIPLQARMPLIPGINDDETSLSSLAAFLAEHGALSLHCLPFHRLGESKYEQLGRPVPFQADPPGRADLERAALFLKKEGIDAIICD